MDGPRKQLVPLVARNCKAVSLPVASSYRPTMQFKSIPESAFEDLCSVMDRFQQMLSEEQEVGTIAGASGRAVYATSVELQGQMIVVSGVDEENRPASLIQHYTQLSIHLVAMPKLNKDARRIGF